MSNLSDLPIRLVSQDAQTAIVAPYGFPMRVSYEYDRGEPPILGSNDFAHPGYPATVSLLSCLIGETNVYDMLSPAQVECVEEAIMDQLE